MSPFCFAGCRVAQQQIEALDSELDARLNELSAPICFVPPDCRFSEAIEFLSRTTSSVCNLIYSVLKLHSKT